MCLWKTMSPLVENYCFRGYRLKSCSKPTAVQIHDFPKEHNPLENLSTALLIAGLGPQTSKKAFLGTEPDMEHHPSEPMRTLHLQTRGGCISPLCPGGCHREKWAVGIIKPAGGAELRDLQPGWVQARHVPGRVCGMRGSRSGKRWLVKEELGCMTLFLTAREGEAERSGFHLCATFQHTVAQSIAWNPTSQQSLEK